MNTFIILPPHSEKLKTSSLDKSRLKSECLIKLFSFWQGNFFIFEIFIKITPININRYFHYLDYTIKKPVLPKAEPVLIVFLSYQE